MNGIDEKMQAHAREHLKKALEKAGCPVELEGEVFVFPFADLRGRLEVVEIDEARRTAHLHFTLLAPEVLATPLCDCWTAFGDEHASAIERGGEEWVMGNFGPLHDAFAHGRDRLAADGRAGFAGPGPGVLGPKPTCFWPDANEPVWAVFAGGLAKAPQEAAPLFAIDEPKLRALLSTGLADQLDPTVSHRLRFTYVMVDEETASVGAFLDETWEPHTSKWLTEQPWPKVQFGMSRCYLVFRPVAKLAPGPLALPGTDADRLHAALAAKEFRAARGYLTRLLELDPANPALSGAIAEYAASAPRAPASPSVEGAAAATLYLEAERALRQDDIGQAAKFGVAAISVREDPALEKRLLDYLSVERLAKAQASELTEALEYEHELTVELMYRARKAHPDSKPIKLFHAEYLRKLGTPDTMALASQLWREVADQPDAPPDLVRVVVRGPLERCDWEQAASIVDKSSAPELQPLKLFLEARVDADPEAEKDLAAHLREHPDDAEAKSALHTCWLYEHALPHLPRLADFDLPSVAIDLAERTAPSYVTPDPRKPRAKVSFQLWTYERTSFFGKMMGALEDQARVVPPVPSDRWREAVRSIAVTDYSRASWSELAKNFAHGPGFDPKELAAVMVHPPARPDAFSPAEWRFRVQVAAALILARAAGDEWTATDAGRLLLDLFHGPLDTATIAVIVAMLDLALRQPAKREAIRDQLEAATGTNPAWKLYFQMPAQRALRRLYPEEETYREWLRDFERTVRADSSSRAES